MMWWLGPALWLMAAAVFWFFDLMVLFPYCVGAAIGTALGFAMRWIWQRSVT